MKIKKTAFTIPELLIFLTIVGVVSVMMMTIIKPGEKYLPYAYYNAYNALSTAAFNIKEDANDNNMSGDATISDDDKYFPGALVALNDGTNMKKAAKDLCKKLANKPDATDAEDEYGYINTSEYYCDKFKYYSNIGEFKAVNETGNEGSEYAFRATNSMKFYISALGGKKVRDAMNPGTQYDLKYFIVWVDLNGDRRPNTPEWAKNKATDIVPFIITTSGKVIPVGGPTIDTRYTTVRLKYPSDSSLKYSPRSMSFLEGQIAAYNDKQFPTYDQLSLSHSFYNDSHLKKSTIYKNTSDAINLIKSKAKLDDRCKFTDGDAPACTILIDENTRL